MMSDGHSGSEVKNTLRAALTQCFMTLTAGVSEADQLQRVLEELTRASWSILVDLVEDWHQKHYFLRRMPKEIIACCFECLPFRDRVRAAHVSRDWRAIALAHPAVWADIDLRGRLTNKTALLEMALARSAQHPVVIRGCVEPNGSGTVGTILAAHISHIQYLELPRTVRPTQLTGRAPFLRFLDVQTSCMIRQDFLGGQVGQLRTLQLCGVVFPPRCPALSTVTHLTLHPPFDTDYSATYRPLFRLFPALQSLSLLEVEFLDTTLVPEGPAPPSLRRLALETPVSECDACECYEAWASVAASVSEVTITQYDAPTRHLRHIVSGAIELHIGYEDSAQERCNLVAIGPGERRRTLSFWCSGEDPDAIAQTLLDVRSSLTDVRVVDIASASFVDLLAVLPALPRLASLTLTYGLDDSQRPSSDLANELSLLSCCPSGLQSLTIRVERHGRPPTYAAEALLAELAALDHENVKLPDIFVRGISTVDVLCMRMPCFDGFRVIFDEDTLHPGPE